MADIRKAGFFAGMTYAAKRAREIAAGIDPYEARQFRPSRSVARGVLIAFAEEIEAGVEAAKRVKTGDVA